MNATATCVHCGYSCTAENSRSAGRFAEHLDRTVCIRGLRHDRDSLRHDVERLMRLLVEVHTHAAHVAEMSRKMVLGGEEECTCSSRPGALCPRCHAGVGR